MKPQTITINDTLYRLIPDTEEYHKLIDNIYSYIEDRNFPEAEKLINTLKTQWGDHLPDYTEAVVYLLHIKDHHKWIKEVYDAAH